MTADPDENVAGEEAGALGGDRAGAAAYYVQPLVWLGAAPDNVRGTWTPKSPEVNLDQLEEVIAERDLPLSLKVRAHRDGMLVFDFSMWAPYVSDQDAPAEFADLAALILRRVSVMNAHLACLHTALARIQNFALDVVAVSPRTVISVDGFQTPTSWGFPADPWIAHIHSARYVPSYNRLSPRTSDRRIFPRILVQSATLDESLELLAGLLKHQAPERAISIAELLTRSAAAYTAHDYSQGLMTAWLIIESLLQEMWERYIEANREREVDGQPVPFINNKRRDRLVDGRDMTASLTIEILSLLGLLPVSLYRDLNDVRAARNKWVHDLRPVSGEQAARAVGSAEEMLRLVEGIELKMPLGLQLHI